MMFRWKATNETEATQRGFTLVELAVATFVLLFGLVAVMQIVPAALRSHLVNRNDSTSTVVAQRLHDLMVAQPLTNTTFVDPTGMFPCGGAVVCNLGGGVANGDFVNGGPLLASAQINFAAATVAGYGFFFVDPNDPNGGSYDVRWAVISSVRNVGTIPNVVVAKRFVIGVRQRSSTAQPVSMFSTWISR